MKSASRVLVALLLSMTAAAAAFPQAAKKASAKKPPKARYTLKVATLAPTGSSFHQILEGMGEEWRSAPGGGVALKIYEGGSQGTEIEAIQRMRLGSLDGGLLMAAGMAEIDDSVEALQSMPMMFRSLEEVEYVRNKLRQKIEQRFLDKGFVVLFWADAGWVHFFTKSPVVHPDDLKKVELFAIDGDTNQIDIMKAAGYKPVPLSPNDILTGLQTGLISGVPTIPTIALAGQFYSRAPHMLQLNWAPLVGGFVVTRRAWEKLPAETRKALSDSARRTGEVMKATARGESDKAVAAMAKRKLTVHKVTPEIEQEWRAAAEKVYPQIRGRMIPADFFDDVRRLLAEYRKNAGGAK